MWLTPAGDTLFFSADDHVHGRELWRSGASGQCLMVADVAPGLVGSYPDSLFASDAYLYFRVTLPRIGRQLRFLDLNTGEMGVVTSDSGADAFHEAHPFLLTPERFVFFAREHAESSMKCYAVSPGRTSGCEVLADFSVTTGDLFLNRHGAGSFLGGLDDDAGQLLVKHVDFGMQRAYPFAPSTTLSRILCHWEGRDSWFVLASTEAYGNELFLADGKSREIRLLKDICPGPCYGSIGDMICLGGYCFFSADDGVHGAELWRTDGTEENTVLLKDIAPGKASSGIYRFTPAGDLLFFFADDGIHGKEVWRTDGTEAGTYMACDLNPGVATSGPWSPRAFQGLLYFCAKTPDHGEEVFVTDGTSAGTRILKDITPGPGHSGPDRLTVLGNTLFFTCNDGIHGEELWLSDGAEAGARLAMDIGQPRFIRSSNPHHLTAMGNRVVFAADDHAHGHEPWISDGAEQGTALLADIMPGKAGSNPDEFVFYEGRVYFTAEAAAGMRSLWHTEGDRSSTRRMEAFGAHTAPRSPSNLHAHRGRLFFTARDAADAFILWCITPDHSAERALDLSSHPVAHSLLLSMWDALYLYMQEHDKETALFRLQQQADGSWTKTPVTLRISDIKGFAEAVPPFVASDHYRDALVWVIRPPDVPREVREYAELNGRVYFSAHTEDTGMELWGTDGTPQNTLLIKDVFAGPASSGPSQLTVFRDALYFIAENRADGRVLYTSRGTPESTGILVAQGVGYPLIESERIAATEERMLLVAPLNRPSYRGPCLVLIEGFDLQAGCDIVFPLSANPQDWPQEFVAVDDQVFFAYAKGGYGTELWVTHTVARETRMVRDIAEEE